MSKDKNSKPKGRLTPEEVADQQTLQAIKNIFDNRKALTKLETAYLIKLGNTLKERIQGNDEEEEEE